MRSKCYGHTPKKRTIIVRDFQPGVPAVVRLGYSDSRK